MNGLKISDTERMSAEFQIHTVALLFYFVKLQSMYGNAITENKWASSHNCEYLNYI